MRIVQLGDNGFLDPKETMPKAEAAVRKALELDESLAEAHSELGGIKRNAWDWAGAEIEYKRAIELNPNLATAHGAYSVSSPRHGAIRASHCRGKTSSRA